MSRRRRCSFSDDEEDTRNRKRRKKNDSKSGLESLITRVGEQSNSLIMNNIERLADVLYHDLPNYKHLILKILSDCVLRMPDRITIYTTLVGLLNAKNYNCGGEFVEMLVRNLKECLKSGNFESVRIIVRFLSDLVNCHVIAAGSLLSMFDNFVEVTLEDNIPQVRSDFYVFTVLSSLPWIGRELYEKNETELDKLILVIESYINKRSKSHVDALKVWSSDTPHPQEEYLDCLWAQIKNLKSNKWMERQIPRHYLAFDNVLCEALQHTLPQITPPPHHEDTLYPLPSVVFRMFDYTDVPDGPVLPGSHSIERYLIEEQLNFIIGLNSNERKDCASLLVGFHNKNNIPLNYMIVEVILSQLLNLPQPPFLEIFYGSLLIELCKLQPSSMPQVLAQATEMLFTRIESMKTSCIVRVSKWFSYHLSNFLFCWSWDDWVSCVTQDVDMPKPKFIQETLLRCLRFSYHQRTQDFMPADFSALLPQKPSVNYKYEREGSGSLPGTVVAHQLKEALKNRCSTDDVLEILKDLPNPLQDDENEPTHNPLKIDVFVSTILYLGSKSFSHSFSAIAKFHYIFKTLVENEEGQICLLKTMYDLWKTHQQMLVVLIDKLLKTQIIECSAVANWLFSDEMSHAFTSFFVWEIMHSTIKKMMKHVTKLQKEVDDARERHESAQQKGDEFDPDNDEIPSAEMIERMVEKLEAAQSQQKNLFLILFQRFIILLTEHFARCEAEGIDWNTPTYKWVIERLQEIFLTHHELVFTYIGTLENLLFTSDIDVHILEVFQQFCALRS
ncbi:nuclear cap-binding protein subunit 1-like [Argonauta hians]